MTGAASILFVWRNIEGVKSSRHRTTLQGLSYMACEAFLLRNRALPLWISFGSIKGDGGSVRDPTHPTHPLRGHMARY